jgi:hypothetical protein
MPGPLAMARQAMCGSLLLRPATSGLIPSLIDYLWQELERYMRSASSALG